MHTFLATNGNVKLSDILAKDEPVKIWTEAWSKAGFDPIILTTKDASLHPQYNEITHKLSEAGIDENRWGRYLRFAAMSAKTGGWYSDKSILPLGFNEKVIDELPNEGKFMIHQSDGGIELMSGSKEEWEKMVKAMTKSPMDNDNALLKSLLEDNPKLVITEDSMASSIHLLKSTGVDLCKLVTSKKLTGAKFQYRIAARAGIRRRSYYEAVHSSLSSISHKCNEEKAKRQTFTIVEKSEASSTLNKKTLEASNDKNEPDASNASNEEKPDASNTLQLVPNKRPIIHTFFQPAYGKYDRLLVQVEVWKNAWEDAGWEPVVLSLEDAQRHSYFNRFKKAFDNAKLKVDDYNRMCFYRWLAMAASGGGWMSDYDTMPLHSNPSESLTLPNNGKFTSYQMHVPALIVGNKNEWERMSKNMYEFYNKHDKQFYSDMLALRDIQKETKSCVFDNHEVISPGEVYREELRIFHTVRKPFSFDEVCPRLKRWRAIHFSHAGCSEVGFCKKGREVAVEKWIQAWRKECATNA